MSASRACVTRPDEDAMAEQGNGGNGSTEALRASGQIPIQAKIVSQYIKDLSFENPNIRKLIASRDQPNWKVEVNVGAQRVDSDLYETSIDFKATATIARSTFWKRSTQGF